MRYFCNPARNVWGHVPWHEDRFCSEISKNTLYIQSGANESRIWFIAKWGKYKNERTANCQLVENAMASCRDFLTSSSPSHHRRAEDFPESGGEILNTLKWTGLFLLTSIGPGFHPKLLKMRKLFGTTCYSERPWEIYVILFRKPLLMSHI